MFSTILRDIWDAGGAHNTIVVSHNYKNNENYYLKSGATWLKMYGHTMYVRHIILQQSQET